MPGAKHFSDLDCWKLSNELKVSIYAILRRPHVVGDLRFVDDVRDAAASAPRNIAEGFGRRSHREFAHFLDIARGSLHECQNHLNDAVDRGYIEPAECEALLTLSRRAAGATAALQRYLRRR
jgi:four helix bundle protein